MRESVEEEDPDFDPDLEQGTAIMRQVISATRARRALAPNDSTVSVG